MGGFNDFDETHSWDGCVDEKPDSMSFRRVEAEELKACLRLKKCSPAKLCDRTIDQPTPKCQTWMRICFPVLSLQALYVPSLPLLPYQPPNLLHRQRTSIRPKNTMLPISQINVSRCWRHSFPGGEEKGECGKGRGDVLSFSVEEFEQFLFDL